jgi:superfamily II DNA or RNA helicase
MPRVTLLLADDVGLGKTIEAGLILAELIQRRRIRRVLVVCPASLRGQWQRELHEKFALAFEIVDRERTWQLKRDVGIDANPWRSFAHAITSHDYLKQSDVFESFLAASRPDTTASLPWDLLIVDEVHNLSPAVFGEDSAAARMLRRVAPFFEHRLFLSATPHNGHTPCFTGLLECLDPVRFAKERQLTARARERARQVVIRRLKRDINIRREARGEPRPFCQRELTALTLRLGSGERSIAAAFAALRSRLNALLRDKSRAEFNAGRFAISVLGKRLLSCPATFAESWQRYKLGLATDDPATVTEVSTVERQTREEQSDDLEIESQHGHAATVVGAWLKPLAKYLSQEMHSIDTALEALGLATGPSTAAPAEDSRFDALVSLIEARLRQDGRFVDGERVVVFTEFKTTLDILERRLVARYPDPGRIRVLYGGPEIHGTAREEVIAAFNSIADPVRVLIATDAASEGLNLQETSRLLLHFDIPWNPSRLEQRNGRLDRHGQARDVTVFHFATDDDADLNFLAYVVGKVDKVREDLGSTGDVFDAALERRLLHGEDPEAIKQALTEGLDRVKSRAEIPAEERDGGAEEYERLELLGSEVDLDPDTLRTTLDLALGLGEPGLEGPDARGYFRVRGRLPQAWQQLVDDTLRMPERGGAMRKLAFDASLFIRDNGGRPVFRAEPDAVLLHLGHPLFHHALSWYARKRFPGTGNEATRWCVRRGPLPDGVDALILLTVEEMAVNELREGLHHWVGTVRLPVKAGTLLPALPHVPARDLSMGSPAVEADALVARGLWEEVEPEVARWLVTQASSLTARIRAAMRDELEVQRAQERKRFQDRKSELEATIRETTLERLRREAEEYRVQSNQGDLFDLEKRFALEQEAAVLEEERARRVAHYEDLRVALERERVRVVDHMLPQRYAMRGDARLFPVAVEVRLPEASQ